MGLLANKQMTKLTVLTLVLILTSCSSDSIVGTWVAEGVADIGERVAFEPDGTFRRLGENARKDTRKMECEAITEVIPHQLYLHMHHSDGQITRTPYFIYNIVDDRMVLATSNMIRRKWGLEAELPKDFSRGVYVYNRE
jgi:hypothetical protein